MNSTLDIVDKRLILQYKVVYVYVWPLKLV